MAVLLIMHRANLINRLGTKAAIIIAVGFGSGLVKHAPGSCGTMAAFALWALLSYAGLIDTLVKQVLLTGICFFLGLISTRIYLAHCAKAENYDPDPKIVVIDEWAGTFISLTGLSLREWPFCLAAILLFRFFDISKPGPIKWAERLPQAWGVMLDDIVAGICSAAVLVVLKATFIAC